jgi:MFS family permease
LIFLRLCQGFGVGAEQGGALVMATEFAPNGRRGLFAGLAGCGVALGLLMANLGFLTLNSLSDPGWVKAFGWRIPFLFSLVLVGVGLWLRLHVDETPAFKTIIGTTRQKSVPFVQLLVKNWPNLLQIVTLTLFLTAIGYTGLVFAVAYASSRLGVPSQVLLACGMVANLLEIPATIFFASLSDRIGRKKVFLTAVAIGIAFAFVFFQLIDTKSILAIGAALAGLRLITAGMYGPQGAIFAEMFDTEVRFSGVAVGLGVGNIVSALIVSTLFASTGGSPWGPTLFMAGAGVVSFISGMTLKDRRGRDMADTTT